MRRLLDHLRSLLASPRIPQGIAGASSKASVGGMVLLFASLAAGQDRTAHHLLVPHTDQWASWKQVSLLYAGQWGYYLVGQREAISDHGSLHQWMANPANPHFDKDFYDFNLVFHTLTGSFYYGYYRAFGNSRPRSLAMSVLSSLLFEFTVETITERPSFQDMYQTPILGAVVGMGMEDLSLWMLESRFGLVRGAGYLLNPFTLVPGSAWQVKLEPQVLGNMTGGRLAVSLP